MKEENKVKFEGFDNCRKPKSEYIEKVEKISEEDLFKECKSKIWLSAYTNNNPKSDYHWQADVCWQECQDREKGEIYKKAYDENIEACR